MNAISLNSTVFNAARLIGPSLAGIIMASKGMRHVSSSTAQLPGRHRRTADDEPARMPVAVRSGSALRHSLGGLAYVRKNRRLFTLFSLFSIVGVFGWSYGVLMPAYARDVLHVNEAGYGALLSACGLGAMFGHWSMQAWAGHAAAPRCSAGVAFWLDAAAVFNNPRLRPGARFLAIGSFGMMIFMAPAIPVQTARG